MLIRLYFDVKVHWTVWKDVEVSALPLEGVDVVIDDFSSPVEMVMLFVGQTPDYHVKLGDYDNPERTAEDMIKELINCGWTLDKDTPL